MEASDFIARLKDLLKVNKTDIVLYELGNYFRDKPDRFSKSLVIIFSKYNKNEDDLRNSLISNDEYHKYKAQINASLIDLIDEINNLKDDPSFNVKRTNSFSRLSALYITYKDLLQFYTGIDKQIINVLSSENFDGGVANKLIESLYNSIDILADLRYKLTRMNSLTHHDNSYKARITDWIQFLKENLILNGQEKLIQIQLEVNKLEEEFEDYHSKLNSIYNENLHLFSRFKYLSDEIQGALREKFNPHIVKLSSLLPDRLGVLHEIFKYIEDLTIDENIYDSRLKIKLSEFINYCEKNASLDNLNDILLKAKTLADQHNKFVKDVNRKSFSNEIVKEFLKLGIDIGALIEIKKDPIKNLEIDFYHHHSIIDNTDCFQELEVHGRNVNKNESPTHIPFAIGGSLPTPIQEMKLTGIDLVNGQKLPILSEDDDLNTVKIMKVFFASPLKFNEEFKIKAGFLTKNSWVASGKDFTTTSVTFEEKVKKVRFSIDFKNNSPDYIKVLNLTNKQETVLLPNNNMFEYELTDSTADYLNQLRLLYLLDRKSD